MIDTSIITNGALNAQNIQSSNSEALQQLLGLGGKALLNRKIGQMRDISDPTARKDFANQGLFKNALNRQYTADQVLATEQQRALEKHNADIGKTQSEAFKNNQQGTGYQIDANQKKLGAIQGAFIGAAQTGDKTQVLLGLSALNRSGLMTPEDLTAYTEMIKVATPEDVKKMAQGFALQNAKDPASHLFTTADNVLDNETSITNNRLDNLTSESNNIRTNQTSENNNIRTTDTSRYSTDVNAQTAQAKLTLEQARIDFDQKKGTVQQFGDNVYMVYPDGRAIQVETPTGIVSATKSGTNQKEEAARLQRVDTVLPEIEKLLPKATGSYGGMLFDQGARIFGKSTEGAQATAQLKALSGQLVALQPKMSGPQSDKDVAMYKEMAGNLADDTQPIATRMAALQTIRNLNEKYKSQNQGGSSQQLPQTIARPQADSVSYKGSAVGLDAVKQAAQQAGISPEQMAEILKKQGVSIN